MKFCKNCKYFLPKKNLLFLSREHRIKFGACRHSPIEPKLDMVSGEVDDFYQPYTYAETERKYGLCGSDAKYFEPKPPSLWDKFKDWITS